MEIRSMIKSDAVRIWIRETMKMKRFCLCMLLMVLIGGFGAAPALADEADDLLAKIRVQQEIIAGKRTGSATQARQEMQRCYKRLAEIGTDEQIKNSGDLILGLFAELKQPLAEWAHDFNRAGSPTAYIPRELAMYELADRVKRYKEIKGAPLFQAGGADMSVDKLKAIIEFGDQMAGISASFSDLPEPESKVLAGKLKGFAGLLSALGEDLPIPVVNKILKGYGDVTLEMIKTVSDMDERLNRRNPFVNAGTYGDGLARAWANQVGEDLAPIPGLRDAYFEAWSTRRVVWVYDAKGKHLDKNTGKEARGCFIPLSKQPAFAELSTHQIATLLRRRYRLLHEAGVKNPTIDQILYECTRIIRPEIVIQHRDVKAGEGFPLRVDAYRAIDGERVMGGNIGFVVKERRGIFGEQSESLSSGLTVTWQAAENPGRYTIQVDLDEASKTNGWRLAGTDPVTANYVIGETTRLEIKLDQDEVASTRQRPIRLMVRLDGGENAAGLTSGRLVIRTEPADVFRLVEADGSWSMAEAYAQPGPLERTGGQGALNQLVSPLRVGLVPAQPGRLPVGGVRVIASYEDQADVDGERALRQSGRAELALRVIEPPTLSIRQIDVRLVPARLAGQYVLSATVIDERGAAVRVGSLSVSNESGGYFVGVEGGQIDLARRDPVAVWAAPSPVPSEGKFILTYAGAAGEDAIYQSHRVTVSLKTGKDESDTEEIAVLVPGLTPPAAQPNDPDAKADEEVAVLIVPPLPIGSEPQTEQGADSAVIIPEISPELRRALAQFGLKREPPTLRHTSSTTSAPPTTSSPPVPQTPSTPPTPQTPPATDAGTVIITPPDDPSRWFTDVPRVRANLPFTPPAYLAGYGVIGELEKMWQPYANLSDPEKMNGELSRKINLSGGGELLITLRIGRHQTTNKPTILRCGAVFSPDHPKFPRTTLYAHTLHTPAMPNLTSGTLASEVILDEANHRLTTRQWFPGGSLRLITINVNGGDLHEKGSRQRAIYHPNGKLALKEESFGPASAGRATTHTYDQQGRPLTIEQRRPGQRVDTKIYRTPCCQTQVVREMTIDAGGQTIAWTETTSANGKVTKIEKWDLAQGRRQIQ